MQEAWPGSSVKSHWKYISPDGEMISSLQSALAWLGPSEEVEGEGKGEASSQPDGPREAAGAAEDGGSASDLAAISVALQRYE